MVNMMGMLCAVVFYIVVITTFLLYIFMDFFVNYQQVLTLERKRCVFGSFWIDWLWLRGRKGETKK